MNITDNPFIQNWKAVKEHEALMQQKHQIEEATKKKTVKKVNPSKGKDLSESVHSKSVLSKVLNSPAQKVRPKKNPSVSQDNIPLKKVRFKINKINKIKKVKKAFGSPKMTTRKMAIQRTLPKVITRGMQAKLDGPVRLRRLR